MTIQRHNWKLGEPWKGETAFIIGGGPSLKSMDWSLLHGKHCIGCNDAYMLGDWVEVCYWGDYGWFEIHWQDEIKMPSCERVPGLKRYSGLKVTLREECLGIDGIHVLERRPAGLYRAPCIGWNTNTGASAINLALILGARRVVLLGFDMCFDKYNDANWHPNLKNQPNAKVYKKFALFYPEIVKDWKADWADREIVNAGPLYNLNDWFENTTLQVELEKSP